MRFTIIELAIIVGVVAWSLSAWVRV